MMNLLREKAGDCECGDEVSGEPSLETWSGRVGALLALLYVCFLPGLYFLSSVLVSVILSLAPSLLLCL